LFDKEIHKAETEATSKSVMVLAEYSRMMEKQMYEIRDVLQQSGQFQGSKKVSMLPSANVKPRDKSKDEKTPAKDTSR